MADPFSPNLDDLASSAQSAREVAARRLAGNVKARPREVPYPWASMGDWLTEALRPERVEDLFMGLGTDAPRGIRAFHGSPHDFEKFSSENIGTGQGAQSYGHGLYFAENPAVAQDYKQTLGNLSLKDRTGNDVPIRLDDQYILHELERADGDHDALIQNYKRQQADARPGQYWSNYFDNRIGTLERWKALGATPQRAGKMYQVNINAEPEHFLDWDKPMSQQHPNVQRVLRELNMSPGPGVSAPELTGEQILRNMAVRRNMTHEQAAQALREAGIPGIRYLDQGSRNTTEALVDGKPIPRGTEHEKQAAQIAGATLQQYGGDLNRAVANAPPIAVDLLKSGRVTLKPQTSNYVVFNDQLIDILKKYGIAGLIAAGAYHQQEQQ